MGRGKASLRSVHSKACMTAFDTMLRSASIWAVRASQERARSMDLGEMRQTSRSCALVQLPGDPAELFPRLQAVVHQAEEANAGHGVLVEKLARVIGLELVNHILHRLLCEAGAGAPSIGKAGKAEWRLRLVLPRARLWLCRLQASGSSCGTGLRLCVGELSRRRIRGPPS